MLRLLLYFLTLLPILLQAQILPFKTYTVKDGLLSQNINVVTRDKKGLLWIGTPFGINWFDGQRFIEPAIETRAGQLFVTDFFKDNKQRIWVLTFYNGIYKYENNQFTNYLVDSIRLETTSNNIFQMVQYDDSNFIVATDQNVFWFDGRRFELFDKENAELRIQFNSVTLINQDLVLFGSSKGIFIYSRLNGKWTFKGKIIEKHQVNRITINQDKLWVGTSNGLFIYDNLEAMKKGLPLEVMFPGTIIQSITRNPFTGEIWIPGEKLYKLKGTEVEVFSEVNGLTAIPGSVYCDDENVIWLCTGNGLIKLSAQNYIFHDLTKTGVHSMITSLSTDDQGYLWAATYDGLVKKTGKIYKRYDWVNGKRIGYVSWMYNHPEAGMFAGTSAGTLKVVKDRITLQNTVASTRMYAQPDGVIWIGTVNGKVYRMNKDSLAEISIFPFIADFIDGLYKDAGNNLWIGYRGAGIRKYKGEKNSYRLTKEYSSNTGYKDLRVRCAFADQNGNVLWGTRTNGLFIISAHDENKTWHINTTKGLSANWVKAISMDEKHNIYLATNKGVNVLSGSYDSPQLRRINILNENITHETTFIYPTKENILIGTEQGILEYLPLNDIPDTTPPRIYITQLTINGRRDSTLPPYTVNWDKANLDHSSNVLGFEFAGINMKDEQKIEYSYMLEGQDKDWTLPSDRDFITYNLPAGNYKFYVRARNSAGIWSREPATFSFSIARPFWKKWWFGVAIGCVVISFLYILYRYRLQQALNLEKLRSRISTDLHDDIGSTLSSISILSEMALKEKNSRESEDMMLEIKHNSVSLMEKMDDIVWSINPKNDSLENLLVRIKSFAARLFEAKNIEYTITIEESVKHARLSMESRQHIYMMLKEAINNIVKYSVCTQASISVQYQHGLLNILVTDNGKGFDKNNVHTGNGLLNMQSRAQMMKADMFINTSPGKGTSITWSSKIK